MSERVTKQSHKPRHRVLRFERKYDQLAPASVFLQRMTASLALALVLIAIALLIGVAGYHCLGGFNWIDSLLEASMILGGMGPVNQLSDNAAKIFASAYALFSGLMFIGIMGVVLSPIVHRFMHKFHIDEEGEDE
jgi:hypothetical protein